MAGVLSLVDGQRAGALRAASDDLTARTCLWQRSGGQGDAQDEVTGQSKADAADDQNEVDDQSEVFGVQNPAQSAQSRVQVQLLESAVSRSFNRVCTVYFSLEDRNKSFKYAEI